MTSTRWIFGLIFIFTLIMLFGYSHASSCQYTSPIPNCTWAGQTTLIQLGKLRSATTWQAEALCRALQLATAPLHSLPDFQLSCLYTREPFEALSRGGRDFRVVKTHRSGLDAGLLPPSQPVLYFVTSNDALNDFPHLRPCYIQEYPALLERDLALLRDYQAVFSLSEAQYLLLRTYMRYWQIVRKCCGFQSSCLNVLQLNPGHQAEVAERRTFEQALDYPSCQMYNLSAVEEFLVSTTLWQQAQRLIADGKHNPPERYGFDGAGYCDRTVEMIKQGLGFNRANLTQHPRGVACHQVN